MRTCPKTYSIAAINYEILANKNHIHDSPYFYFIQGSIDYIFSINKTFSFKLDHI